jgi:hypothetical protein
VLDPKDSVAVALVDLEWGEAVEVPGLGPVMTRAGVSAGHKLAIRPVEPGGPVRKYGTPIGTATVAIAAGDHVHTQNLESARMRGDL